MPALPQMIPPTWSYGFGSHVANDPAKRSPASKVPPGWRPNGSADGRPRGWPPPSPNPQRGGVPGPARVGGRKMIIRQREDLAQIAVLEDDILVEHYVDRDSATSLIGNVYLGRVQNVLPSMEAAFIDIGRGRNAVLYAGEVDWDAFGAEGQSRKVEKVLKSGQTVLVQVSKDPVGTKGARLTNHVSIPGRYLVYAPSGHLSGISRKLPDNERKRLRDILSDLVGEASVIVRTAAEGASEEELVRDVNRLQAQWQDIEKKVPPATRRNCSTANRTSPSGSSVTCSPRTSAS